MSYGAYCKHCRHYADHHDGDGKCRIYEMGHGGRDMHEPCNCPGYELEPGNDWPVIRWPIPVKDDFHVRVETPALKRRR